MECTDCHDDTELLITCDDEVTRCAPCAAAAGYCVGCGRAAQGGICAVCRLAMQHIPLAPPPIFGRRSWRDPEG